MHEQRYQLDKNNLYITLKSGTRFPSGVGISILEAAEKAGVTMPYSCRTGRCSTCKCKVLGGSTRALYPETGLSSEDMTEGWVLSCVRTAETDVMLQAGDLGSIELPPPKTVPCRISELKRMAPDILKVLLRLPPNTEFRFIPGQYIDVIGPNGVRRSYSLANSSFANQFLELHIKAVDGGALSSYWFNRAKPNDLLRLIGPLGTFFLRRSANTNLVFLATGTGVAPIKAILESMATLPAEVHPKTVTVIWGGRRSEDFYLDNDEFPLSLTYIPVQSHPDASWTGARGYVQFALLALRPDLAETDVYACGSIAMIQSARSALLEAGLPPDRFYSDAFVSSGSK
jgi:CDP-4-dehydro-6-deoxyglucose reductase